MLTLKNGDLIFVTLSTGYFFEAIFRKQRGDGIVVEYYDNRIDSIFDNNKVKSLIPFNHIAMISRAIEDEELEARI